MLHPLCAEGLESSLVGNQHTIDHEPLSASHTSDDFVRVRILTLRADKLLDGIVDVKRFKVGHVYEVGPRLADLLIASGHAVRERRRPDRERMSGDPAESG